VVRSGLRLVSFEDWEVRQMKRWRFRLACWLLEPGYRWRLFKLRRKIKCQH